MTATIITLDAFNAHRAARLGRKPPRGELRVMTADENEIMRRALWKSAKVIRQTDPRIAELERLEMEVARIGRAML